MKIIYNVLLFAILFANAQVGIGTTSPEESLHVIGGIKVSDLQSANVSSLLVDTGGTLIKRNRILGKVSFDGTPSKISGSSCTRISRGNYQITFSNPLLDNDYLIFLTKKRLNDSGYDDPNIAYYDQQLNGFKVEIENGDNGGNPGTRIDLEFMFRVEQID